MSDTAVTAQTVILHQHPSSPFSEKMRLVLGLKNLPWAAVEMPVIMPKPFVTPLTGGYRKTPVMQIGADIYCDTQIMTAELERRFPAPTLFPAGDPGLARAFGFWADRTFFQATVPIIFGEIGHLVPDDFKKDREKMFPDRPFNTEQMKAAAPMMMEAWRAQGAWLDAQLRAKGPFLTGDRPGLVDAHAFHIVWFLNNALPHRAEQLLEPFPAVRAWFDALKKIGHGRRTDIKPEAAIAIAKATAPDKTIRIENDVHGRMGRERVSVMPDDYGRDPVVGELIVSTANEIAILREDPMVGEVVVHFPKVGFLVMPA